jgi:hypothetical protein
MLACGSVPAWVGARLIARTGIQQYRQDRLNRELTLTGCLRTAGEALLIDSIDDLVVLHETARVLAGASSPNASIRLLAGVGCIRPPKRRDMIRQRGRR